MTERIFQYEESPPPAELREVVLSFWSFRTTDQCPPTMEHTVWPDGCVSLSVAAMPGQPVFVRCIQPRSDARITVVPRGSRYWGIRFWPDTGSSVLGVPAASLLDGPVPGALARATAELAHVFVDLLDRDDGWSRLGSWSLQHVPHSITVDPAVRSAIRFIVLSDGRARVSQVAEAAGAGIRQLQRRFVNATGLTLKAFSRVRRLRTALARQMSVTESISRTAAEGGYSDHAHLAREFSDLTGMPPTGVLEHLARIEHRNVVP